MKLNILWDGHYLSGYTNVDPFGYGDENKVVVSDLGNLDDVVDDSEAKEILAIDVLDYLNPPDSIPSLRHWIKKLRRGGTIMVSGVDVYSVCRAFHRYEIDFPTVQNLLYGEHTKPHLRRSIAFTLLGMKDFFKSEGLLIKSAGIDNRFKYYIEATRND